MDPPSIRVVSPRMDYLQSTGSVTTGGTLCHPWLTKGGWKSALKLEELISSVKKTLIEGARIDFSSTQQGYTQLEAEASSSRSALLTSIDL